jgi:hypothetical protein
MCGRCVFGVVCLAALGLTWRYLAVRAGDDYLGELIDPCSLGSWKLVSDDSGDALMAEAVNGGVKFAALRFGRFPIHR